MSNILPFPKPNTLKESLEELVQRTHLLAQDSSNVFWDNPHVQLRMKQRKVSTRQLFDVLRNGKGIDGPTLDKYGDWRIKLIRYTAGREVQVVVVVNKDDLEIVTVI
ncbi:MAG: hypothetical protein K940chlam3_00292 [Chlamydiae bacterium]|nr:hypothetical protein [Chlamydiota bacterium]